MIIVDVYQMQIVDEVWVHLEDNHRSPLERKRYHFRELSEINKNELITFLSELRNYFGFKLETTQAGIK